MNDYSSTRLSKPETPLVNNSGNNVTRCFCTRLSLLLVAVTVAISLSVVFMYCTAGYSIRGQFELTAFNASFRVLWDPKSNRASEVYTNFGNGDNPFTNFIVLRFDENCVKEGAYLRSNTIQEQCQENSSIPVKGNIPDEYWSSTTCTPTTLCGGDTQCDGLWSSQLPPSFLFNEFAGGPVVATPVFKGNDLACLHICNVNGEESCKDLIAGIDIIIKYVQPTAAEFALASECSSPM